MSRIPEHILNDLGTNGHTKHRTFTAAELLSMEIPPVEWAIEGILPAGVTLLAGKAKHGKSWMALGFGIAVATGGVALGAKRVEAGECLYLALEDNTRRLQKRLRKLLTEGVAPERLHLEVQWSRADEGGIEELDGWLGEHPECRLVIIDTLARFKPHSTGKRTQYDEDRLAVDPLAPLADKHNVAILLVHHLRETESDDPLDMIHGSAGLTGGVDGALVLKRKRGDADAYLTVDGRDIEEHTELALRWSQDAATWAIMGDAEEYRLVGERREIVQTLRESYPEPMGARDVAIAIGKSDPKGYNATRQRLYQMSKAGEVRLVGHGKYTLPNNPNNPNSRESDVRGVRDVRGPHNQDGHETRVVNVRKEPYDVYIGRGHLVFGLKESDWHNPFKVGTDGTREEVIEKFERYLTQDRPDLMERLPELEGKTLACWCKPEACHGDVLVRLVGARRLSSP